MVFKVGLDISALDENFKEHSLRGIGRYVRELNNYFMQHRDPELQVGNFDHRDFMDRGLINRAIDLLPAGKNTVRQQIVYPLRLRGKKGQEFDLLHFPAHMDAPSWSVKNYVITVLDLIPLVLSDLYKANKAGWRFKFARWLEIKAIKNASLVIAISENTAHDVNRILGVPTDRIVVTHLGVDSKFFNASEEIGSGELLKKYGVQHNRPIILYVGGIDPRKNYKILLEAFKEVLRRRKERNLTAPVLFMSGRIERDREFPRLTSLIKEHALEADVVMPGFIEDRDLLKIFSVSSAFFFPSLYEGFGLTPLEAMAAGVPVVASNTSCMPEVLGSDAILRDPTDVRAMAEGLEALLESPELRKEYSERGKKRAQNFTWQKTGQKTYEAYRSLAAKQ